MAQKINPKQIQAAPAWSTPTYASGWADYDAGTEWLGARYTKLSNGMIIMKGLAKNTSGSTKAAGSTICTLPVGYRPLHRLRFSTAQAGYTASPLDVGKLGEVVINNSLANGEWVSVSVVAFLAEQ